MYRKRRFAKMYDQYADDIYRYLYVHVRDTDIAEDLMSDTFVKAWKAIDAFDFSQPRPWLYKIAQNLLTDYWRKKKSLPLDEDVEVPSEDESIEDQVDRQLTQEQVQAVLHKLPEQMRSVVTMRFMLGYSARQTAESLEISEENVRVIQYRALKKLKEYLS